MPSVVTVFGGARMGVGALSWIAPGLSERVFGLGTGGRQPVVTQLFGVRDFALGYLTATSSGPALGQVLRLGVAIDAMDAVASARQVRNGTLSTQAAVLVGAGAALFAAIGATTLARGAAC